MRGEIVKTRKGKYNEFLLYYAKYPKHLVMKKVKINEKVYNDFLKAVMQEEMKGRNPCERYHKYYGKFPFSEDENDYGSKPFPKKYENSPIETPEPTELSIAIKNYKKFVVNKTLKNGSE
jgi:hypothetical protein